MKSEYRIEEFHYAHNSSHPIRIFSSSKDQIYPLPIPSPRNSFGASKRKYQEKNEFSIKSWGSTNHLNAKSYEIEPLRRTDSGKFTGIDSGVVSRKSSFAKEWEMKQNNSLDINNIELGSIKQEKPKANINFETINTQDNLKKRLADSLSPSPFRNEDPDKQEEKLKQLVLSDMPKTKNILFSQFYGEELTGEGGHRDWKIALKDHIVHTFESICLIKKLTPVPYHIVEKKMLPVENKSDKKLLIFDLDETLVHCLTENIEKADKIITVTLNTGEEIKAGVNIRPYAIECLKELSKYYELIVFTASNPNYANTVIDLLDPDHTIFKKRLFRNSCIRTDINLFIKDLRIFNRDLRSIIIVDNSIFSFAFQLDNGVPIIPFYDDKEDCIMPKIKDYLMSLKDLADFRIINRQNFSLMELYQLDISHFLKYYYDEPDTTTMNEDKDPIFINLPIKETYTPIKITQKAQTMVDDQLVKLRHSLPKYLASQKAQIIVE